MRLKPYNTIDEMLKQVDKACVLGDDDAAQKNALLNHFNYKKYVGTENQTIVIKEFDETSYNGPTGHDFIKRLNILFDTAKIGLDKDRLIKLTEIKKITADALQKSCQINPVTIDDLLTDEKERIKTINKARFLLQEFLFRAILIIDPTTFKSKKKLSDMLSTLSNKESEVTLAKGRPNFINYYPINYNHNHAKTTRVSINRVVGQATPSTERLGTKLPNFVECGVGYMEKGKYISQFKGYRHSSYTPIKMIDKKYGDSNYALLFGNRKKLLSSINTIKFERRKAAALCAKDMFTELARQKLAKGANPAQPIAITLSSLALLSPIKGDKLFMRRGESEHRQLKESYNALMMYNNREVVIDVDGQSVKVIPSINIMNTPSNWHGVKVSKWMPSTLERNINAEGMNKYISETERHLKTRLVPESDVIKTLEGKKRTFKQKLSNDYDLLNHYLNQKINPSANKTYLDLLKSIEKTRDKLYRIEQKILDERFKSIKAKRAEIRLFLHQLSIKDDKSNDDQIAELYYQSLFIYLDKQVEPAHFGARYLLVNEKMGHSVDFYCKSGEDRTGRMQNFIEELCEFSREKGYFPRYDLNRKSLNRYDQTRLKEIAKSVSEYSVSRDNTDSNAIGARGLQITSSVELNTGLPNASGSRMGTLAKSVYDSAGIKKLWRSLKPTLSHGTKKAYSSAKKIGLISHSIKDAIKKMMENDSLKPDNSESPSHQKK